MYERYIVVSIRNFVTLPRSVHHSMYPARDIYTADRNIRAIKYCKDVVS